jgi:hypothetical protein
MVESFFCLVSKPCEITVIVSSWQEDEPRMFLSLSSFHHLLALFFCLSSFVLHPAAAALISTIQTRQSVCAVCSFLFIHYIM